MEHGLAFGAHGKVYSCMELKEVASFSAVVKRVIAIFFVHIHLTDHPRAALVWTCTVRVAVLE